MRIVIVKSQPLDRRLAAEISTRRACYENSCNEMIWPKDRPALFDRDWTLRCISREFNLNRYKSIDERLRLYYF